MFINFNVHLNINVNKCLTKYLLKINIYFSNIVLIPIY